MNYSDLSDFEINKLVTECRGGFGGSTNNEYAPNQVICYDERPFYTERDFCNNPNDAWPIIVDNEIALIPPVSNGTGGWKAERFYPNNFGKIIDCIQGKPLRAAMIVYLMMKDGESND